ncbi:hypothetical protein AHAS_Ahas15G0280100 [Arachis hypogaea]
MQDKVRSRPPKIHVVKGKATTTASPQPATVATIPVSAETIKGTSSSTAKKLASLMTFVPTPDLNTRGRKTKMFELCCVLRAELCIL